MSKIINADYKPSINDFQDLFAPPKSAQGKKVAADWSRYDNEIGQTVGSLKIDNASQSLTVTKGTAGGDDANQTRLALYSALGKCNLSQDCMQYFRDKLGIRSEDGTIDGKTIGKSLDMRTVKEILKTVHDGVYQDKQGEVLKDVYAHSRTISGEKAGLAEDWEYVYSDAELQTSSPAKKILDDHAVTLAMASGSLKSALWSYAKSSVTIAARFEKFVQRVAEALRTYKPGVPEKENETFCKLFWPEVGEREILDELKKLSLDDKLTLLQTVQKHKNDLEDGVPNEAKHAFLDFLRTLEKALETEYSQALGRLDLIYNALANLPFETRICEGQLGLRGGKIVTEGSTKAEAAALRDWVCEAFRTVAKYRDVTIDIKVLKDRLEQAEDKPRVMLTRLTTAFFPGVEEPWKEGFLTHAKNALEQDEREFFDLEGDGQAEVKEDAKAKKDRYAAGNLSPKEKLRLLDDPTQFEFPVTVNLEEEGVSFIETEITSAVNGENVNLTEKNPSFDNLIKDYCRNFDYKLGDAELTHLNKPYEDVDDKTKKAFFDSFNKVFTNENNPDVVDVQLRNAALAIAHQFLPNVGQAIVAKVLGDELDVRFTPYRNKAEAPREGEKQTCKVSVDKSPTEGGGYRITYEEHHEKFAYLKDGKTDALASIGGADNVFDFTYSLELRYDETSKKVTVEIVDGPKTTFKLDPGKGGGLEWHSVEDADCLLPNEVG